MSFFSSRFHGFEKLKLKPGNSGKPGMCFIKFQSPDHAAATLQALSEGVDTLPSNPTVPVRAEWAKNDLDQPRDAAPRYDTGGGWPMPGGKGGKGKVHVVPPPPPHHASGWQATPVQSNSANVPCDTLFIGSLPHGCQETELESVLSGFAGFVRMKMTTGRGNMATAFALFDSVATCTEAVGQLHGMALQSTPHQAMNCEFARNSLDKRQKQW